MRSFANNIGEEPGGRYDHVIIADNYLPRMEQIAGYLRETGRAESIDKLHVDRENPAAYLEYYNNRINEVLGNGQRLLVAHNFYVGLKNGYWERLRQAENETGQDAAKRLVISCINRDRIRGALNRKDLPLVEIVDYSKELGVSIADLERALSSEENMITLPTKGGYENFSQAS